VARVPPSASAHPPTGRHGYPRYHPPDVAAWRAELEAAGRMTDAGRRAVEVARANGYRTLFDSVEDLVVPDDLASALDAAPGAREVWDAWPRSVRKPALWSLLTAARPETRAARIERVVAAALAGRRPG